MISGFSFHIMSPIVDMLRPQQPSISKWVNSFSSLQTHALKATDHLEVFKESIFRKYFFSAALLITFKSVSLHVNTYFTQTSVQGREAMDEKTSCPILDLDIMYSGRAVLFEQLLKPKYLNHMTIFLVIEVWIFIQRIRPSTPPPSIRAGQQKQCVSRWH